MDREKKTALDYKSTLQSAIVDLQGIKGKIESLRIKKPLAIQSALDLVYITTLLLKSIKRIDSFIADESESSESNN